MTILHLPWLPRVRLPALRPLVLSVVLFLSWMSASGAVDPCSPNSDFFLKLISAAVERTTHTVTYDGGYRRIGYPMGDVPDHIGVCTDVVIRSYRAVGIDLQEKIHQDMHAQFDHYPKIWGLTRPDPNIDHRRVPNLQTFFHRHGCVLTVTQRPTDYKPGDLVTWRLPGNLPHIGIVTDRRSVHSQRPLIVHNIGQGPQMEDMLFNFPITGHYRYSGDQQ